MRTGRRNRPETLVRSHFPGLGGLVVVFVDRVVVEVDVVEGDVVDVVVVDIVVMVDRAVVVVVDVVVADGEPAGLPVGDSGTDGVCGGNREDDGSVVDVDDVVGAGDPVGVATGVLPETDEELSITTGTDAVTGVSRPRTCPAGALWPQSGESPFRGEAAEPADCATPGRVPPDPEAVVEADAAGGEAGLAPAVPALSR